MNDAFATTLKLPLPDQIIAGKYKIISRIGAGGMGLVFLAEQLGVGKRVALKFLDPAPNEDDSRIARFLREAKVGLAVQHPGAAQVLDLGRDESLRLFLCFELVEGEDLRELIKREGRLRYGEAKEITLQVAQVLAFAHERGIVHRDVKPENIRVRRDLAGPHVKMIDFGIARLLKDAGVRLTAEGMLAGTPRYMAPEQVKDEPFDGRADQYALGLVFYEMLTGVVAINGKNVSQILMQQIQGLVPPLAFVDAQLGNAAIDGFIAKACAKEPAHRFPSMAEFVTALKALDVDEVNWPAASIPPTPDEVAAARTRDGKQALGAKDLSDTFVRVPERTELERRVEVPTDPVREPVQRRSKNAGDGVTAPLPVHEPAAVPLVVHELGGNPDRPTERQRPQTKQAPVPVQTRVEAELERPPPQVHGGEKSSSSKRRKAPAPSASASELEHTTLPPDDAPRPTVPNRPLLADPLRDSAMDLPIPKQSSAGRWVVAVFVLLALVALGLFASRLVP